MYSPPNHKDETNPLNAGKDTTKEKGFTMKLTLISLEETQEQEDERIHADEDEQTWCNAALQDIPEERQSKGWYDEKPQDLVSIFRSKTNRMEYLDEQDDYT